MKPTLTAVLATALLAGTSSIALAEIKVMASIKPVHSLVASIMQGVGTPSLIVKGSASLHTYSLKPSQADELQNADVVFWVGHELEAFLEKPIETIATKAKSVELINGDGISKLPPRENGNFDKHNDEPEPEAGHEHDEEVDAHIWLDPQNATLMAAQIEKTLVETDPDNAAKYTANAAKLKADLAALQIEIQTMLEPTKDKGFIVFHDAYQYFEQRFGVKILGSITTSPEVLPGAERLTELKAKLTDLKADCVFAEPNFEPKLVNAIVEGTPAKTGTLDPEASGITEGPALYGEMMRGIATSIRDCLSQVSSAQAN
jgi:zinc transport system substrate-binding protein